MKTEEKAKELVEEVVETIEIRKEQIRKCMIRHDSLGGWESERFKEYKIIYKEYCFLTRMLNEINKSYELRTSIQQIKD
jgi:hypothetical protein